MKNEYTSDFLKYDWQDEYFSDCFSEFVECLTEVDLSKETIDNLYGIFLKDTKRYFKKNIITQIKEIRDNLAYTGGYYGIDEAVNDLSKLLGDEEE